MGRSICLLVAAAFFAVAWAGPEQAQAQDREGAASQGSPPAAQSAGARGATGAEGPLGVSGSSGESGEGDVDDGFVDPKSPFRAIGEIVMVGYDATTFKPFKKVFREAFTTVFNISVDDVAVTNLTTVKDAGRRRLLSEAGNLYVAVGFLVASDNKQEQGKRVARIGKLASDRAIAKEFVMAHRNKGLNKCVGVKLSSISVPVKATTTTTTTTAPAVKNETVPVEEVSLTTSTTLAPKQEAAMGLSYSWTQIGDPEIDAASQKVAEWMARAQMRIEQEQKAVAAVKGTRGQVNEHASAAAEMTSTAQESAEDGGDGLVKQLEKTEEHTQEAKDARRRLKVLREYRRAVSAKRKVATTTRDSAIAELLRLKVLRINTAKQMWMTLANKVVDLHEVLRDRLEIAHQEAEIAHRSELATESQEVSLLKHQSSERATAAARHTKLYLDAVIYKTQCAEALLHDWECKVQINCTKTGGMGGGEGGADDAAKKPAWSTPALDALAEKMNEAVGQWKSAKSAVPEPKRESPKPPKSAEERAIDALEKKFRPPQPDGPNRRECQCRLEGGKCGRFVTNGGGVCQPIPEEGSEKDGDDDIVKRIEGLEKAFKKMAKQGQKKMTGTIAPPVVSPMML